MLIALVFALAPGAIAIGRVWRNYVPPTAEARHPQFVVPADLADQRAWLWADLLTGTFWYYARQPAYKVIWSDTETRILAYSLAQGRNEPQYVIRDSQDMQAIMDEIVKLGGTLEQRGEVDGYPYFLIHWPENGPLAPGSVAKED